MRCGQVSYALILYVLVVSFAMHFAYFNSHESRNSTDSAPFSEQTESSQNCKSRNRPKKSEQKTEGCFHTCV